MRESNLFLQAERGTKDFLKTTITYYASNSDKVEAVTVAWDGIMSQVHILFLLIFSYIILFA